MTNIGSAYNRYFGILRHFHFLFIAHKQKHSKFKWQMYITISDLRLHADRNVAQFVIFYFHSQEKIVIFSIGYMYLKAGLNCMTIRTLF